MNPSYKELKLKNTALYLKGLLNQISHVSYSFSKINQEFPIDRLDHQGLLELISSYERMIEDTEIAIKIYKERYSTTNTSLQA